MLEHYSIDASPLYNGSGLNAGDQTDYKHRRSNTTLDPSILNQGAIGLPPIFNHKAGRDSLEAAQLMM